MTRAATAENSDMQSLCQAPVVSLSCTETTKVNNPKLAGSVDFKATVAVQQWRKQPLDGRTPRGRICPDPLLPHGKFCGCGMLSFALSAAFTFLVGDFVPCHCTERFHSVSFSCTVDTSHSEPAAKSHSSLCMGLFMFTIMTECKEGWNRGKCIWQEGK